MNQRMLHQKKKAMMTLVKRWPKQLEQFLKKCWMLNFLLSSMYSVISGYYVICFIFSQFWTHQNLESATPASPQPHTTLDTTLHTHITHYTQTALIHTWNNTTNITKNINLPVCCHFTIWKDKLNLKVDYECLDMYLTPCKKAKRSELYFSCYRRLKSAYFCRFRVRDKLSRKFVIFNLGGQLQKVITRKVYKLET